MQNTMCGMSLICGNIVRIKSLGDVYPNKSINLFCNSITNLLMGDTSDLAEPWERFLNVDYFGQPCHAIVTCFAKVVNGVKWRETFRKRTKCPKIQSLFVKFLTYGGLISWAHFLFRLATFTSCSRLTMFLSGLRPKPQDRMMPKRLSSFCNLMCLWDLVYLGLWLVIERRTFAT